MHDGQAQSWREVVEKHHAALIDEISVRLDSQLQSAVSYAIETERAAAAEQVERAKKESGDLTLRSTAESLNQIFRRLHHSPDRNAVIALLSESVTQYAAQTALLEISEGEARVFNPQAESVIAFAIDRAPAVGSVFETGDPVVTLATADQLSPALAAFLGPDEERRVYLYPVSERQKVTGILVAAGPAVPAMLEVLSEAAALKLESLAAAVPEKLEPLSSPGLVQIEAPAASTTERRAWNELSAEDQKLHLQAQRVARVRVAEIRLYHAEALRRGATDADIYGAVQTEIDAARTEFLQTFLSKSPTMVDYLHLEILRSLAHDDDRLLGKNYPGPMV